MKKQLKSLLLVTLLIGYALPIMAQASTEGKEFWVALNITTGTGGNDHAPFICITTQHAGGSYTITNPADPTFTPVTGPIPPTGYIKINASTSPKDGEIDLSKWYPVGQTAQAMSCQTKNVGLKVTTTVECSVFAGNRLPQSFDAANILPITALQTDYITQDYPGFDHENKGGGYPVTTILATENNTQVRIDPSSAVLNNSGTATITRTLNAGQVLYITGDNRATLSGTSIISDKKIAVFTGVNNTDVPGPVSARDHLYEQNMPVDYWGTHFVVTRSMKKDANRIRVTASNNGTDISVDGYHLTTINAGETYEFELCSATMRTEEGYTKADAEKRGTERFFTDYAHYLETSCPCAVFSYDVSENYYIKKNGTSERDANAHGDPSMVWISPLEQQLRKVTFGVMNTDKTPTHYVNIITPTSAASTLEVREVAMNAGQVAYGNNMVQPTDVQPVPGNPAYSYARIKLVENKESVYTITSGTGFIAHVYGSGDKESYAYSCGSAAVQQGVKVAGVTFPDGYRNETDKFCIGAELDFDASVGTDEITRVDWDFGDGITENNSTVQVSHKYTTPGWYDVKADLYGHQVCTDESELPLGSVTFSFRVARLDTIPGTMAPLICIEEDSVLNGQKLTAAEVADLLANGKNDTVPVGEPLIGGCYETVVVNYRPYGIVTREEPTTINLEIQPGEESVYCPELGEWFTASDEREKVTLNEYGCNNYHPYLIKVKACLYMDLEQDPKLLSACEGNALEISYKKRGDVEDAHLIIEPIGSGYRVNTGTNEAPVSPATEDMIVPNQVIDLTFSWADGIDDGIIYENNDGTGTLVLPTDTLKPGIYDLSLVLTDANKECGDKPSVISRHITVKYPESVVVQKFNNVLAVLNAQNNGGYKFVGFQWYRNGEILTGETTAVYHTIAPLTAGDTYYVELTDAAGNKLPSCDFVIPANSGEYTTIQDETDDEPAAQKLIQNNRIVIRHDGQTYDIFGQKVR